MVSNAALDAALAPYRGAPAFSSGASWDLVRAYAEKLKGAGLPLSDADLAEGVKRFGAWHIAQFGEGITAWSSPIAVAAQSVEEAVAFKTAKPAYTSPFWAAVAASGDLARGDQAGMLAGQIAYRSQHSYGEFSGFDNLMQAGIKIGFSAALGAGIASEFGFSLGDLLSVPTEAVTGADAAASLGSIDLAAMDSMAGLVPEYGTLGNLAADLAAADAAAGLMPEYGTLGGLDMAAAADSAAGLMPEYGTLPASPVNAADLANVITESPSTGVNTMSFSVDENGVLDLSNLAAQDYADFGVQGVQDLGDSLNYSNGLDWVSNTINASNPGAVNDIFGSIGNAIKGVGNVIKAAAGAVASTRTAVTAANRVQPNYTAAAGSVNVGLLALGAAAFFALKG